MRKVAGDKRRLKQYIISVARTEGTVTTDDLAGTGLPDVLVTSVLQELIQSGSLISKGDEGWITYSLSESERIGWDDYINEEDISADSINLAKKIMHDMLKYCQHNGMPVKEALTRRMIRFFISPRRYGQKPPFTLGWSDGSLTLSVFIRNPNADPSRDSCPGWKWNDLGRYWYLEIDKDLDVEAIGPVLRRAYEYASKDIH